MKTEFIRTLTVTFEGHAQQIDSGVEYWLARDLQHLLRYAEWRYFYNTAILKARTVCEVSRYLDICFVLFKSTERYKCPDERIRKFRI